MSMYPLTAVLIGSDADLAQRLRSPLHGQQGIIEVELTSPEATVARYRHARVRSRTPVHQIRA